MPKPTAAKVSVQCPHCGAHQLEPALVQSTYCRACGQHFEVGLPGHDDSSGGPSTVWGKISGLFRDNSPRVVCCFECGTRQEVVRTATSSSCKSCGSYMDLQDFKIDSAFSRAIRTAGTIHVTSKGDLNTDRAVCGAAELRGPMRGTLVCTGEISVRYKGRISGGIETDVLRIDKKSGTEFMRPVRAREVHIEGEMSGRILSAGTVHIGKSGRMSGTIFARGIDIEVGGEFRGELSIGEHEVEESGQLPLKGHSPSRSPQSELGLEMP